MGRSARLAGGVRAAALEAAVWLPLTCMPLAARAFAGESMVFKELLVSLSVTGLLTAVSMALPRLRALYFAAVYTILAIGCVISIGTTLSVAGDVHVYTVLSILDSNAMETREFLSTYYSPLELLFLVPLALPPLVLATNWRWFGRPKRAPLVVAVALAVFLAPFASRAVLMSRLYRDDPGAVEDIPLLERFYPLHHFLPSGPYRSLADAVAERIAVARASHSPPPHAAYAGPAGTPLAAVVVIGESASRHHLGIYGYRRATTPRAVALGAELFVFSNVVASHLHTEPALAKALALASHRDPHPARNFTVIDALNAAGFETTWISHQPQYGLFESATSLLVHTAQRQLWLNRNSGWAREDALDSFDEIVLPAVEAALHSAASTKAIFVHLMGSHAAYDRRVPASFRRFSAERADDHADDVAATVDAYDDSILYSDHVVAEIIERVRAAGGPAFVVYLSDHGEDVYDCRDYAGHNEADPSVFMTDVPFLVWLSEPYRHLHPDRVRTMTHAVDRPWQTDDLMHAIADLADLRFDELEIRHSLFADGFVPEPIVVGSFSYEEVRRRSDLRAGEQARPVANDSVRGYR